MKKFVLSAVLISALFFFAFRDYDICSGTEGYKSLACSACHGGSFASDVFILDGKTDPNNEAVYSFDIRIPDSDLASLQLAVNTSQQSGVRVEVDMVSAIREARDNALFSLISLSQKSANGTDGFFTTVHLYFDEAPQVRQSVALQGVLSNNDGTPYGDQAFSKELIVEPKAKKLDAYVAEQTLYVNEQSAELLRIVDMQGRIVYEQNLSDRKSTIDLSHLNQGVYQAIIGNGSQGFQSMAFQLN